MMFIPLEGDNAILSTKGVFRQVELATRDGYLYAKAAGGFIRLYADGPTSKVGTRLDALSVGIPLARDRLGKLCSTEVPSSTPISEEVLRKLAKE